MTFLRGDSGSANIKPSPKFGDTFTCADNSNANLARAGRVNDWAEIHEPKSNIFVALAARKFKFWFA